LALLKFSNDIRPQDDVTIMSGGFMKCFFHQAKTRGNWFCGAAGMKAVRAAGIV
jgi:hypothetical protein